MGRLSSLGEGEAEGDYSQLPIRRMRIIFLRLAILPFLAAIFSHPKKSHFRDPVFFLHEFYILSKVRGEGGGDPKAPSYTAQPAYGTGTQWKPTTPGETR